MVELCDVTLREGTQAPGAVLSAENKIELAHLLDDAGVHQIQVALPGLSRKALEETSLVCRENYKARTEVMSNATGDDWQDVLGAVCDTGADVIHSFINSKTAASSPEEMTKAWTRIGEITDFVHDRGRLCNISFIGALDAERSSLLELIGYASEKTDRMRVADSYGAAWPEAIQVFTEQVIRARGSGKAKFGLHLHNDMGLALADALAGVKAGADFIDVSINGLGSRAGNVVLMEAAYALTKIYGLAEGLDLKKIAELSRRTAELFGVTLSNRAPFVGENVFDEELDIHALEILNNFPCRGIDPRTVGGQSRVLYGRLTTPQVLRDTARNSGRPIREAEIPEMLEKLDAYCLSHRGAVLYEEDLWRILN